MITSDAARQVSKVFFVFSLPRGNRRMRHNAGSDHRKPAFTSILLGNVCVFLIFPGLFKTRFFHAKIEA